MSGHGHLARTMQAQLDPLITIISARRRGRMTRREIARRQRGYCHSETEKECIDMLFEWLYVTCSMSPFSEDETETVGELAQSTWFTLIVVYLEGLVTAWTQTPPSTDRLSCLQTLVDLLESVASKKEQTRFEVRYELIASFLLCAALWNNERGVPLVGGVAEREEVFAKSHLFALVRDETELVELVRTVRRQQGLGAS